MRSFNALLLTLGALSLPGADPWPQWRGPARDGRVLSFDTPAVWPASLASRWSASVGEGYSTPVLAAAAICAHGRQGQDEVVSCFAPASGKPLWKNRYPAPFEKSQYATRMASGPYSTPLAAGDLLFTMGVNATLTAYELKTGKIVWRRQPAQTPTTKGLFTGTAMSPMLDENRLIVFWGDDRGGEMLALDPASGRTLWSYRGDRPVYSSPIAAAFDGKRQYITLAEQHVISLDAASGKLLWKIPYKDEWNENIVTPVAAGDLLIISGVRKPVSAYRIRNGVPVEAWSNKEVSFYMSTPVLDGGRLYGLSSRKKGQLVALDARTGALLKASEGRWAENAHLVVLPRHLAALTSGGELVILDRGLKEQARYELTDSPTWAHPVFWGRQVFVRDATSLRAFGLP